jgi:hypothetical protein
VSRRDNYEAQRACFAAVADRGILPGAEVARFWCVGECGFFFFSDWSRDRLTNEPTQGAPGPIGVPVPLFQLVFHGCYVAGFSGGGYAAYAPGYDWWRDGHPRLYELLFAAAPAHNWLPDGDVPIRDRDGDRARARCQWLRRWCAYSRQTALSPMTRHRFLDADLRRHHVEFANGVSATFDLEGGRMRVKGVAGFSGDWETPPVL